MQAMLLQDIFCSQNILHHYTCVQCLCGGFKTSPRTTPLYNSLCIYIFLVIQDHDFALFGFELFGFKNTSFLMRQTSSIEKHLQYNRGCLFHAIHASLGLTVIFRFLMIYRSVFNFAMASLIQSDRGFYSRSNVLGPSLSYFISYNWMEIIK